MPIPALISAAHAGADSDLLVADERHLETAPGRDPVQCGDDRFSVSRICL